jgi:amino acid adenylation domain-containing protein
VPLDPGYPRDRLAYMVEDSAVKWLLTQDALLEKTGQLAGEQTGLRILSLDGAELQSNLQRCSATDPRRHADQSSHNLAYVIYTSGSTGQPKGAMNEHQAVVNRLHWMQERYALGVQDRVLQKTPFSFDVSVWEFFWTLSSGAQLIVARPEGHKDPAYLSRLIQRRGVTRLHFVPSMLQAFLDQDRSADCASLRQIVCSGEELSAGLLNKCLQSLPQVRLSNLYGPTEAAVDVTSWECGLQDENARVPIGRPIANLRIYILNAHSQPAPVGVMGEIYIGGVGVGRGYLNRPELTAERFIRDPFSGDADGRMYRTGDLGRWRADGAIEYLGRNDHQVKIRGFRIELGEIENQLAQHEEVGAAVVVAREDADGEKRLVAYVTVKKVGRDSDPALVAELKDRLERNLPEYMVPALFVVLDELPLTSSGKIDRKALPAPEAGLLDIDYVAPQTQTERTLVEICAGLLQLKPEEISTTANFFALGGHSLLLVQFMISVKSTFNVELGMKEMAHANVRSIARSIDALQAKNKLTRELLSLPENELEQVEF